MVELLESTVLDELDDSIIEDKLLDRPLRGIYDIAYTYGQLNILSDAEKLESDDVNSEYLSYMTPNLKIDSYFGKPNTLISVRVKWDSEKSEFEYDGVDVEELTWDKAIQCGYSRPIGKSGRMIAHSICQLTSTSGYDFEGVASKLADRFTRWPSNTDVRNGTENHKDEWIIEGLQEFGENVVNQRWKDNIAAELETVLEGEDTFKGLQSVKINIGDGWKYPGEFDVINEGMKSKKISRLSSYSEASDASGEGVCYITGEEGVVYGMTPGSPGNFYTGKQVGSFTNFDVDSSWAERPLSAEAAMIVSKGASVLNDFGQAFGDMRLAYYPYYDTVGVSEACDMYTAYESVIDSERNEIEVIGSWMNSSNSIFSESVDLTGKQLYGVYYWRDQEVVYVYLNEVKQITDWKLAEFKSAHIDALSRFPFKSLLNRFVEIDVPDSWFFDKESPFDTQILSGSFWRSVVERESDENPRQDQSWNEFDMTLDMLSDEPIQEETLFARYVERLKNEQAYMFNNSDLLPIPTTIIWKQYIHSQILSDVGVLQPTQDLIGQNSTDITMVDNRTERLEEFISTNSALDDSENKSAFVLGCLVGRMSQYQRNHLDVSRTVASQYPIGSLTTSQFQVIVQEMLDKTREYSEMKGYPLFSRYTKILTDTVLESEISEWDISTSAIRYYYAIGLAYGYNDYQNDSDTEEEDN